MVNSGDLPEIWDRSRLTVGNITSEIFRQPPSYNSKVSISQNHGIRYPEGNFQKSLLNSLKN